MADSSPVATGQVETSSAVPPEPTSTASSPSEATPGPEPQATPASVESAGHVERSSGVLPEPLATAQSTGSEPTEGPDSNPDLDEQAPVIPGSDVPKPTAKVWPKNFDQILPPAISLDDFRRAKGTKLNTFFSDLNDQVEGKEVRRCADPELCAQAEAYTAYFWKFIKAHRRTGIKRMDFAKQVPLLLPGKRPKILSRYAFERRLRLVLEAYGATHERYVVLPDVMVPILRIADDRLVNEGPAYNIYDGQVIMILAAIDFSGQTGYRTVHKMVGKLMNDPGFLFRGTWTVPTEAEVRGVIGQMPRGLLLLLAKGYKSLYAQLGLARTRDYGDLNHTWMGDAFFLGQFPFIDPAKPKVFLTPGVSFIAEGKTRLLLSHEHHLDTPDGLIGLKVLRKAALPPEPDEEHLKPIYGKFDFFITDGGPPFGAEVVSKAVSLLGGEYEKIIPGLSAMNSGAETRVRLFKRHITAFLIYKLRQKFKGVSRKCPLLLHQYPKFKAYIDEALVEYMFQTNRKLGGMSPLEAAREALEIDVLTPLPVDLIMRVTSVEATGNVLKEGITFAKQVFYCDELKALEGREVRFVIDPFAKEPCLNIIQGTDIFCHALLVTKARARNVREALKEPGERLQSAVVEIRKELRSMAKDLLPSDGGLQDETREIQARQPKLAIPMKLDTEADLFSRLGLQPGPWQPGSLVDTVALRTMERAAGLVAGQRKLMAIEGRRGNGKSAIAKALRSLKSALRIDGEIVVWELTTSLETKKLMKAVAQAVTAPKQPHGDADSIPALARVMAEKNVRLLIVDNAHYLPPEALTMLTRLAAISSVNIGDPEAGTLLPTMAPEPIPPLKLGILLLATRLEKDRVAALRDGGDWEGVHDLPHLTFEEAASLLRYSHSRFAPILERARGEGTDEAKFLRALYGLSEGTFQRFENILRRLAPLLQAEEPPTMQALNVILEEYARINSRGSPQREKPPQATVF